MNTDDLKFLEEVTQGLEETHNDTFFFIEMLLDFGRAGSAWTVISKNFDSVAAVTAEFQSLMDSAHMFKGEKVRFRIVEMKNSWTVRKEFAT